MLRIERSYAFLLTITVHTPQPSIRNPLRYLLMWVGVLLLRRICKMLKLFESKLSEFWHLAYL